MFEQVWSFLCVKFIQYKTDGPIKNHPATSTSNQKMKSEQINYILVILTPWVSEEKSDTNTKSSFSLHFSSLSE